MMYYPDISQQQIDQIDQYRRDYEDNLPGVYLRWPKLVASIKANNKPALYGDVDVSPAVLVPVLKFASHLRKYYKVLQQLREGKERL